MELSKLVCVLKNNTFISCMIEIQNSEQEGSSGGMVIGRSGVSFEKLFISLQAKFTQLSFHPCHRK